MSNLPALGAHSGLTFDAQAYADTTRLFGNAARNSDNNANKWAQQSLAAVLLGNMTLHSIAVVLYAELQPKTAKGLFAEPKESSNGDISVSSLRGASKYPCKGGDAARKAFTALQYIVNNQDVMPDEVLAFALGNKNSQFLFGLESQIKAAKAAAAKAAAAATPKATVEAKNTDTDTDTDTDNAPSLTDMLCKVADMLTSVEALSDIDLLAVRAIAEQVSRIEQANQNKEDPMKLAA